MPLQAEVLYSCPTGGDPRADPGHTGEIMSLSWCGNVSVEKMELVERELCFSALTAAPP